MREREKESEGERERKRIRERRGCGRGRRKVERGKEGGRGKEEEVFKTHRVKDGNIKQNHGWHIIANDKNKVRV